MAKVNDDFEALRILITVRGAAMRPYYIMVSNGFYLDLCDSISARIVLLLCRGGFFNNNLKRVQLGQTL